MGHCIVLLALIHPEYQPSPTIFRSPGPYWYLSASSLEMGQPFVCTHFICQIVAHSALFLFSYSHMMSKCKECLCLTMFSPHMLYTSTFCLVQDRYRFLLTLSGNPYDQNVVYRNVKQQKLQSLHRLFTSPCLLFAARCTITWH